MGIVFAFKNTLKGDFLERQEVKNHAHLCSVIKMIFKSLNCENSYVKEKKKLRVVNVRRMTAYLSIRIKKLCPVWKSVF